MVEDLSIIERIWCSSQWQDAVFAVVYGRLLLSEKLQNVQSNTYRYGKDPQCIAD
ncbi:10888_t:CDS:2 [Acaulospora morrowiae]|uniref:10888_t:CDS:1 n=1 Tax=Acaulospora morrowiae TaxID=94023 RepID=A0A9N9G218_9GLOM|nr:10888_t:CDS:2 [Acaulospora morrowiae]